MAIEYIKRPYVSPIDGVTNTKTGWKLTRDSKGMEVIEELAPSAQNKDRYFTNMKIPINNRVYIWYQMELSSGEVKDYVGPFPYESRESNVTNDIKPVMRIETPYITVDEDSLYSGSSMILLKSSVFRGDRLDGHLSSTWFVKSPDGVILHSVIDSSLQKYEIRVDRSVLGLGDYDYVYIGLKHHGANGGSSDFYVTKLDLSIYPFKFIGDSVIKSTDDYRFSIKPYNPANPNISKVRVVNSISNELYLEFTNMADLNFTIPAYTLPDNTDIRIESYVQNTVVGDKRYPLRLDTNLVTASLPNRMDYDTTKEYDFTNVETYDFTSHSLVGSYHLINNKTYVLSLSGMQISRLDYNPINGLFDITPMTIDSKILPYMSSDSKLLNLRDGSLMLVSRVSRVISFVRMNISGNSIIINDRLPVRVIPCLNVNHELINTVAMDLTDSKIYLYTMNDNNVSFMALDIRRNVLETLPIREDVTKENYKPLKMILLMSDYGNVVSFGGHDKSTLVYEYVVKTSEWIPREMIDASIVNNIIKGTATLLVNKEILLLGTYNSTGDVYMLDRTQKVKESDATISITTFNVNILDNTGRLYLMNSSTGKIAIIKPK